MGVSEAEESEPLLIVQNGTKKPLLYNDKKQDSEGRYGSTFHREVSPFSIPEGSGSSGGGSSPDLEARYRPHQRITYTWHDIRVNTSGVESRRQRVWRNIKNMTGAEVPAPQRKHILHGVNGAAYPGELMALMGASGAGKTSLLNVLTFKSSGSLEVAGMRCINGVPISSNELTSISAYVQQDDLFIGTLTVKEHLIFQALVRMDRHIPYNQRMARVAQVISELALTKCENTVIGIPGRIKGISGGEMKRLSFASEVLTDPPIMFCDEPTSGLDSFMAQNVVSVLKSMALKGKTVIVTIHQPSSEVFAMFDKVLLMAEGRVAYLGTPADACSFFNDLGASCPTNYNPADFFIQLLAVVPNKEEACRDTIGLVCDAFDQSQAGLQLAADTELQTAGNGGIHNGWSKFDVWDEGGGWQVSGEGRRSGSPYKANWIAQFRAVLWRSWLSVTKDPLLIKVRLLQTMMVAGIISIIYFHQRLSQDGVMNINGVLFIFISNMTFQNVYAVVNVFCTEIPVFMREHFNGMYRVDVYFLSKTLAETPVFVALPIIFTSVTYYAIGLYPAFSHFITAMFVLVLVANVALSFGYLISCVSSSITMALSISAPLIIPFLLFGGFFLNADSVPSYFKVLSYFSWFRYGNEALLINQWAAVDAIDCTASPSNTTCPRNGAVVLETLGFDPLDFALDIWCLFLLIVLFRFVAYLALLYRTYRKD